MNKIQQETFIRYLIETDTWKTLNLVKFKKLSNLSGSSFNERIVDAIALRLNPCRDGRQMEWDSKGGCSRFRQKEEM